MFTGLVEALGLVTAVVKEASAKRLSVQAPSLAGQLVLGESVAINGVCLTVVAQSADTFACQAGPETLHKTNLGDLQPGERVNLERALRFGDRLGGHLVQGHVEGVGTIHSRQQQGAWLLMWFTAPPELLRQMVPKGSVTIDGVSLTLVEVTRDRFSIALIPHTLACTTLGFKPDGAKINLETDLIGKYVTNYLQHLQASPSFLEKST